MGFNLIYGNRINAINTFWMVLFLEKCRKIWKNGCFYGRLRPDWGNAALAATAGSEYIG